MLFQVNDEPLFNGALRKFEVRKYFAFSTFETNELGFIRIRHLCFANKATLKLAKFLNPDLPCPSQHKGITKHTNANPFYFAPSTTKIEQKFLLTPHKKILVAKQDIAYVGIACKIDLIKTSLPP